MGRKYRGRSQISPGGSVQKGVMEVGYLETHPWGWSDMLEFRALECCLGLRCVTPPKVSLECSDPCEWGPTQKETFKGKLMETRAT